MPEGMWAGLPPQDIADDADAVSRIVGLAARSVRAASAGLCVPDPVADRGLLCYGDGIDRLKDLLLTPVSGELSSTVCGRLNSVRRGGDEIPCSYVAVPAGEGVLCIFDYGDRAYSDADVRIAEDFAALAVEEVERSASIQTLRKNEERFRAVTKYALDVVAVTDADGRFTFLSDAAESIFGFDSERGIGRSIFYGVPDEDRQLLRDGFAAGAADAVVDVEYRYLHPDGGLRYLRLRGRGILEREGLQGFLVHVRDATERVRFEDELRRSRDRAEEMSRLKSVFLTNISHEIRTPLTTIVGFAEILLEGVDDEKREFVELIQQGGKRLLETLTSILDLARLESKSFEIEPEYFDVSKKVIETCHLLEPLAHEKGLYLDVNFPPAPVEAYLDLSALERTVKNLVSNGLKFTSEGGVAVSVEADEDDVLIHVADTGIGISEEFMPSLFDEFKQESEGLSRAHEGSGLGLPITKRLVKLMKGDIMADSQKGQGTVFTVALPRNAEKAGKSSDQRIGAAEEARPRVLVVEDNADTRTLVNHLLRKSYDVLCVSDGEEALARAAESNYDALLVDINLGKGKSGEDVLHDIKNLPGYAGIPVVAVTAYAMPGDRERFFAEGFDDYVSKPFSKQRLLEALEGVLE